MSYLEDGDRVLDLGAGSCENALWLPAGCRYVGCDVSTTALAIATEKGRPGTKLRGNGTALPVATACLDAVLSTWALEHFHDPAGTLLEAVRVLRPGGLLLLVGSTWDLPYEIPPSVDPKRRLEVATKRLGHQLASLVDRRHRFEQVAEPRVLTDGYVPDADAVHIAQSWQVIRFLSAAGMEIVERQSLAHGGAPGGLKRTVRGLLRLVPPWRHGWGNLLVVARRGDEYRRPPARLAAI